MAKDKRRINFYILTADARADLINEKDEDCVLNCIKSLGSQVCFKGSKE